MIINYYLVNKVWHTFVPDRRPSLNKFCQLGKVISLFKVLHNYGCDRDKTVILLGKLSSL